jgi:alanyl-tRNA synthetase
MVFTHLNLRKLFADFWKARGNKEVPPIPLVPKDDPTTLFTGSGMQPLIPYLMGERHPLGKKLYNIQPCFRSQDIEFIGDNRHTTFFEMMGNWSLGDYFKKEQLEWCLEFFTKTIGLPKARLFVSIFKGTKEVPKDEESVKIWKKLGIPDERIFYYGTENNWWSRSGTPYQMPPGEIGGPDSEVFYDFGIPHNRLFGQQCHPNCECGRFLEIGNSVFIQYKKKADGMLEQLPQKNVDFGGGLERIMMVLENNPDMFSTSLYYPIVQIIESITNKKYQDEINRPAIRTIVDHLKASVFLIKDGITPSNKEQGYVLRRLLRRSIIKMRQLKEKFEINLSELKQIIGTAVQLYENIYFKKEDIKTISPIIEGELIRFSWTLERGLKEVKRIDKINGKIAFYLYQSYGFPLEITEELFREKGQVVNREEFRLEFVQHCNLSRSASVGMFKGGLADQNEQTIKYHTATHLLHQALKDVFGDEVRQEGSNITAERLRFDFRLSKKLTDEGIKEVENIVNQKIKGSLHVYFKIMPKSEAVKIGAASFFKEKYGDQVKVYFIDNYSKEFCGGPHVKNTSEIGSFKIIKVKNIGAGLMRIYGK